MGQDSVIYNDDNDHFVEQTSLPEDCQEYIARRCYTLRTDYPEAYAKQFSEGLICELTDTYLPLRCEYRPQTTTLNQFCDAWTNFQHRSGNGGYTTDACKNDETITNEKIDQTAFSCVSRRDTAGNHLVNDDETYARCYYGGASSSESVL